MELDNKEETIRKCVCGKDISHKHPNTKYCWKCKSQRKIASNQESASKRISISIDKYDKLKQDSKIAEALKEASKQGVIWLFAFNSSINITKLLEWHTDQLNTK